MQLNVEYTSIEIYDKIINFLKTLYGKVSIIYDKVDGINRVVFGTIIHKNEYMCSFKVYVGNCGCVMFVIYSTNETILSNLKNIEIPYIRFFKNLIFRLDIKDIIFDIPYNLPNECIFYQKQLKSCGSGLYQYDVNSCSYFLIEKNFDLLYDEYIEYSDIDYYFKNKFYDIATIIKYTEYLMYVSYRPIYRLLDKSRESVIQDMFRELLEYKLNKKCS